MPELRWDKLRWDNLTASETHLLLRCVTSLQTIQDVLPYGAGKKHGLLRLVVGGGKEGGDGG